MDEADDEASFRTSCGATGDSGGVMTSMPRPRQSEPPLPLSLSLELYKQKHEVEKNSVQRVSGVREPKSVDISVIRPMMTIGAFHAETVAKVEPVTNYSTASKPRSDIQ